jgi:hypothetical protein
MARLKKQALRGLLFLSCWFACNGQLDLMPGISWTSQNFRDLLFSIAPGEFIGVYGILRANAVDGSSDGFNTLSMAFDGISQANLQAASIPVPAAARLFGSGLLGLISIARRK